MQVILKEDMPNLGYKDDIVTVKDGYGRNFLIPQRKAVIASESAKKILAENMPIVPLSYENNTLKIQVPTQFFYEYLEDKYVDILGKTLHRIIGPDTILKYSIQVVKNAGTDATVDLPGSEKKATKEEYNTAIPGLFDSKARQDWESHLNSKYTFDNYYEGVSNRLVRATSEEIARNPGKTYNPMFIYGPSGVGKTHLCHDVCAIVCHKYNVNF